MQRARTTLAAYTAVGLVLIGGCARPPEVAPSADPVATVAAPSAQRSTSAPPGVAPTDRPLTGKTIVIDPGHTGGWTASWGYHKVPDGRGRTKACNSSGTATRGGYSEHAYNFAQAQALASALRDQGARVLLTRSDDRTATDALCVNHRADLLNSTPADLLISLHADGNLGKSNRGFHLIVSTAMAGGTTAITQSKELAADVRDALQADTPMPRSNYIGGGTAFSFRSDLGTLNFAKHPAVMIEMGNMMNATDASLFTSTDFRTKAAAAIAAGVVKFLG